MSPSPRTGRGASPWARAESCSGTSIGKVVVGRRGNPLRGHAGDVQAAEIDPSGARLVTMSSDNVVIVWDVRPDGGFGTFGSGMPGRWTAAAPAVVEPGRLVVVPTRGLPPTESRQVPYGGEGTLDVAATFIDPAHRKGRRPGPGGEDGCGRVVGCLCGGQPRRTQVAVTSGLATTVLDARTREVVKRIELPPNEEQGRRAALSRRHRVLCRLVTRRLPSAVRHGGPPARAARADGYPAGLRRDRGRGHATWQVVDHVPLDRAPTVLQLDDEGRRLAVGSSNSSEILVLDATPST